MKGYKTFSKIIIILCGCLMILTVLNFFTGVVNAALSGSSHVICLLGLGIAMSVTVISENERIKKGRR